MKQVRQVREPFKKALELFQDGAYASVDEFGMLAKGQMQKEVQELKRLMTFVLGLVNPRYSYDAAYFPFVNALFKKDSAVLRDDISILTFNYDPHLEFMIARGRKVRIEAAGAWKDNIVPTSAILSGFLNDQKRWHEDDGFFLGTFQAAGSTNAVLPVYDRKSLPLHFKP